MKQRSVDRRSYRRFEIVGMFLGSLELWRPLKVRNLGAGGAAVETTDAFSRDWQVRARVARDGRRREMRVNVRHATRESSADGYLVGLQFPDAIVEMVGLTAEPGTPAHGAATAAERRGYPRIERPNGVEIQVAKWTTVELADVSMGGAMLIGSERIDLGSRAHFRARFGEHSFEAEIESRRIAPRAGPNPRYGIGASFTSMAEESRRSLASFLSSPPSTD